MTGILVHGDNHFIVSGPLPPKLARALAQHWSIIQIGRTTTPGLERWRIVTREFRKNLEWAVVVRGGGEISAVVNQLLEELSARVTAADLEVPVRSAAAYEWPEWGSLSVAII